LLAPGNPYDELQSEPPESANEQLQCIAISKLIQKSLITMSINYLIYRESLISLECLRSCYLLHQFRLLLYDHVALLHGRSFHVQYKLTKNGLLFG
jgi:hypothetical protein